MKSFAESLKFDTPLEPRQAFFGGRSNTVCLHKDVNESEKIHYVDFTSLHPRTNKYCEIPIQYSEILTSLNQPFTKWALCTDQVWHPFT